MYSHVYLESFNVRGTDMSDEIAKCVGDALIAKQTPLSIDIRNSPLSDKGICHILSAIKISTLAIKQLHLPYTEKITRFVKALDRIRQNSSLPLISVT